MNPYPGVLFFLVSMNTSVCAQETFELTDADSEHINETTQNYNLCVQQNAIQQLDNYADIRQAAAHAVNLCEPQLNELREKLGSKANSDFYSGYERHIKNKAIRNLLPMLMYEKSARQDAATEG